MDNIIYFKDNITFEEFKKILEKMRELRDAEDKMNDICRNLNYKYKEYAEAGRLPNMEPDVIFLLEAMLKDKSGWISYWVYEKDYGRDDSLKVTDADGNEIPLTTIEDLWKVLIDNIEDEPCG